MALAQDLVPLKCDLNKTKQKLFCQARLFSQYNVHVVDD